MFTLLSAATDLAQQRSEVNEAANSDLLPRSCECFWPKLSNQRGHGHKACIPACQCTRAECNRQAVALGSNNSKII